MTKLHNKLSLLPYLAGIVVSGYLQAQSPAGCAKVGSRANSNGQANSCPNNGGTMASNFVGTPYATVPGASKTGNLTLTYAGANTGLLPYAITNVWLTTTGTTVTGVQFGPAGTPVVNGGNTDVSYCFYGINLSTIGTLSFELRNPQTGIVWGICSYDATCNSACVTVANPTVLPIAYSYFKIKTQTATSVGLEWETSSEQNNKGFYVERSTVDSSFTSIAFVPSLNNGNSSSFTKYSYVDADIPDAISIRYRLRQQDLDGRSSYTGILAVQPSLSSNSIKMSVTGGTLKIEFLQGSGNRHYVVNVYDPQGKECFHDKVSGASKILTTTLQRNCVYYISVQECEGNQKVVKSIFIR